MSLEELFERVIRYNIYDVENKKKNSGRKRKYAVYVLKQ